MTVRAREMRLELDATGEGRSAVRNVRPVLLLAVTLSFVTTARAQDQDCTVTTAQSTTLPAPGYRLPDGEFVPQTDVQASPDGRFWRCPGRNGLPGLLFAPPHAVP